MLAGTGFVDYRVNGFCIYPRNKIGYIQEREMISNVASNGHSLCMEVGFCRLFLLYRIAVLVKCFKSPRTWSWKMNIGIISISSLQTVVTLSVWSARFLFISTLISTTPPILPPSVTQFPLPTSSQPTPCVFAVRWDCLWINFLFPANLEVQLNSSLRKENIKSVLLKRRVKLCLFTVI